MSKHENELIRQISGWAAEHDAVAIVDSVGHVAVQARHWDDEDRRILRHRPDPVDYRMPVLWIAAKESERLRWIC